MFSAISFHIASKTGVEPVKWMPAKSGCAIAGSPTLAARPGMKLMTPSGRPAAWSTFIT